MEPNSMYTLHTPQAYKFHRNSVSQEVKIENYENIKCSHPPTQLTC